MALSFYKRISCIIPFVLIFFTASAQSPAFFHLNSSNGLSDNNVRSVVIDQKGFLWIGTTEGLNLFDGYAVTTFMKDQYPEMASNNVIHLTCDSRNRIWLGTSEGISWVDEKRKFHRVVLNDSVRQFASRTIMDTKTYGPVLYTSLGQFFLNEKSGKWEELKWIPETLKYKRFHDADPFDENKILYATDSLVMIVDYANNKVVYQQPFSQVYSLCRYNENEIAIGVQFGLVHIVNIHSKQTTKQYQLTNELNNKKIISQITEVRLASNGNLLVATAHAGLVVIDNTGKTTQYVHDPINPGSIGSNETWRVLSNKNGDVILGTSLAGISVFNINTAKAGYVNIFSDGSGNFYDNYVAELKEGKDGIMWIGGVDRLIKWDRKNKRSKFFYSYSNSESGAGTSYEVRALCIDKNNRVWTGSLGNGVCYLDEKNNQLIKIPSDTSKGIAFKTDFILHLYPSSDGMIWVATTLGVYNINPDTKTTISFRDHPVLKQLEGKRINRFIEDSKRRIWMASNNDGVYCFDRKENKLSHFSITNGLNANQCFAIHEDKKQNIYVATAKGFCIISNDGNIKSFDRNNGLPYERCDGILEDEKGNIWMTNVKCVVLFDPLKQTIKTFDQNAGLTAEGFRTGSYTKSSSGELFWGSRRGINYFFPNQLANHSAHLKVNISQVNLSDSSLFLAGSENISLRYNKNNIVFRFAAINLQGSKNIQYRFKLEGYDKEWQKGIDIREARYSLLPPGDYNFKLMASANGINWMNAENSVSVSVIPPLYQRFWFIFTGSALLLTIGLTIVFKRNKKIKNQKEQLETERAINYFGSSMSEHQTEENILWDVAKNCIGRLQFEDCVIYIMDKERKVLVQKAAHGPKNKKSFEILSPIEIKPGQGIVGSVALSKKAEIIRDTTKDERYIVDDQRRHSEISVPIIYNDTVLGVIDCEHSKKSFFTQKHLSILTTIASLCANKIMRVRAEKEKLEAQVTLSNTQQKMTEIEMQALRAQMNPHFIFNCLNSINRYIVKSDQTTASLYLTKFAKLIRLILDNSNVKNVILTNELEALKLYIEMESLRFDKKFSYDITVQKGLSTDNVEVPPLIIQPYVENAIWHGLLHKEENGHLSIRVNMNGGNMLECIIEDNGVGRTKASELKSKTATSRKSLGMQLTESRLSLLNKHAEMNASVQILDLENGNGEPKGTKVILKIPV